MSQEKAVMVPVELDPLLISQRAIVELRVTGVNSHDLILTAVGRLEHYVILEEKVAIKLGGVSEVSLPLDTFEFTLRTVVF